MLVIKLELTRRAMLDLHEIKDYSIQAFGQNVASEYLDDVEAALSMIQEYPDLLKSKKNISNFFQFYQVRNHYLVCTRAKRHVIVLTIKHCQMDIPERLLELEPNLLKEAELLYGKLFE